MVYIPKKYLKIINKLSQVSFKQMFKEESEDISEPFTFCVAEDECQIVEEDFVDFEF